MIREAPFFRATITLLALSFLTAILHPAVGMTAGHDVAENTSGRVYFWLTLLHNNDGESQLLNAGDGVEEFWGVARFATVVRHLKKEAIKGPRQRWLSRFGPNRGVVLVSSGDNFLAGAEFNASLQKGIPFSDAMALDLIGYNAIAIGRTAGRRVRSMGSGS
jgi:hypothetical protein